MYIDSLYVFSRQLLQCVLRFIYGLLYCLLAVLVTVPTILLQWYVFELPVTADRPEEDT